MAKKKSLVNSETDRNVDEFIEAISNQRRKTDSKEVLKMIQEVTGLEPKIWGVSIVGFGKYKYQRKNGEEYEWFNVGFSPAKAHLSVYVMFDLEREKELLSRLGPHKHGRGCLYIKKLDEIDHGVLREIIEKSFRIER
ncbi:MAG: DUF1801 domain-containing protein [Saprospiraceae bacterium]|nr:DUF1801 domain-containing protein [Saprospiraceae bacterium]